MKVKMLRNEGIQISLLSRRLFKERRAEIVITQTLLAQAQVVFDRSQYYCPVDTGLLKNTAFIEASHHGVDVGRELPSPEPLFYRKNAAGIPVETQYEIGVRIVYPQDYAIFVHENQDSWHTPPTGAKFLSRASAESFQDLVGVGAEAYANAMKLEFIMPTSPSATPEMAVLAYGGGPRFRF